MSALYHPTSLPHTPAAKPAAPEPAPSIFGDKERSFRCVMDVRKRLIEFLDSSVSVDEREAMFGYLRKIIDDLENISRSDAA